MLHQSERHTSGEFSRRLLQLTLAGGFGFWLTNLAISLTPIAAEYRAALSIAYLPMLLEALVGGLLIGLCVSYCMLRFFDNIAARNPIRTSILVSVVALIVVTLLIEAPAKLFAPANDALRYFLIGTLFNVLRILALGIAIGYSYERINRSNGGRR